ncbi:MAG TPA: TetR-like C-terminal domain-containing protein [Pseudonocardia sp.]|nr:TetR-like C-terminal domain-containing protein [Pseudonocardia sp.]
MARKAGLTTGDVVGTAAALADREGLDAVTLSRVAAELGVRSPSLYAHVDGLPGLRRLLALRAAGLIEHALGAAVAGRRGPDALRRAAYAFREVIHAHPGLYAATLPAPGPDDDPELYAAMAAAAGPVVQACGAAGLDGPAAVHATRALRAAVHGFAVLERGGGFGRPLDVDRSFETLVDTLVAGLTASLTGP